MSAPRSTRRKVDGDAIRREVEERIESATGTLPADLIAPNPAPLPEPEPEPVRAAATTLPTGMVRATPPWGGSFNTPWSNITRWLPQMEAASAEFPRATVPLLAAVITIETQGNHYDAQGRVIKAPPDGYGGGRATGLMQIKDGLWANAVPGADINDPAGNIRIGAKLLHTWIGETGSWQGAIAKYHPGTDPRSGTNPQSYVRSAGELMAEWTAATGEPDPVPVPDVDPLAVIMGKANYMPVTYGWLAPAAGPWYDYGIPHGLAQYGGRVHTGIDLRGNFGDPIYSPIDGTVVCSATDSGPGAWNTGCAAFRDTGNADPANGPSVGAGRVEVMAEDGSLSVIFGHARTCLVKPGNTVKRGQQVCTMGGANGPHIHLECRVPHPADTYHIVDPVPVLKQAMGASPPPGRAGYVHYTNVPGAPNGLWLPEGLSFRVHLINPAQRNQRPGIKMTPQRFVQHETGNPSPGANADMHLRYLLNGAPDQYGRPQQLSYHFTVDEREAILMIPLDEVAWHGGDGAGPCNMGGIASELCVQDNNRNKDRARANAEALAAAVMESLGLNQVEPHRSCSGKDCPHYILAENYWPAFVSNVAANRQRIRGGGGGSVPPPAPKYGELSIPVPVFEALFLDPKLPADPDGAFTRWMAANDWYYPVHKLVRDGQESYLITGGGVLHYRDGVVTVLDDDAAAAIAERAGA